MYGYGPFEQPSDAAPAVGRGLPRWVMAATLLPGVLVLAWLVAALVGAPWAPLGWLAVVSLAAGFGSVFAACLYHLAAKFLRRPS